ncbi:uncharacterized protein PEZ65_023047 [Lycodopsis pacificus]
MDEQENPLERDHSLSVVLPGGLEKNTTVHGSKPVMDLLVTLCASYHLNPSDYTVEVLSPNKNNIGYKPNSPIGSLEADTIVLKPKGMEEKIRRPYMPEASVRLLINYNKSHKAVVRVNPRVPLETLLPVVCDKCEFRVATTVLLRDSQSGEPLDLTESLNDLGLREVFAKDTADPRTPEADLPKKEKKQKDETGFLCLFRRRKKNGETVQCVRGPASPGRNAQAGVGASSSNTLPADMPKKRRAPQPPMGASQSVPNNLGTCHVGGSQRSAESTLRSTKRRAPPPPSANTHQELKADTEVKDSVNLSLPSSSSTPHPSHPWSSSFSSRPSFAHHHDVTLPSFRGMDLSDARSALAKVLTSSVSKGTLVKRLRNSASFPKFSNGSFFVTQRCSDNGLFCAELEPVRTSNLPTEHEWQDPVQRKVMTTFKVDPLKTQTARDPEPTPDQISEEDDPESEASLEAERNPPEAEEDPCSPDESETRTPSQSPEPSSQVTPSSPPPPHDLDNQESPGSPEVGDTVEKQTEEGEPEVPSEGTPADCSDRELTSECQSPSGQSASTDMDRCGPATEETEAEVVQGEDRFPPPPPPIFFDDEEREDTMAASLPSSQPPSPTSNGQTRAFSADRQPPAAAPKPLDKMSAAPSRFAQAVALAVQRSLLQSGGKGLGPQAPSGPLPSPPRSTYQYGACPASSPVFV